ncbi:MAG TPA: Rieske 2Fe-2S domain-containing protein [Candidatus Limnocylindrales bacterium]
MDERDPSLRREEAALVGARIRALRQDPVAGISRRTLLRRSLGLGVGLWLTEVGVGSISFLWNAVGGGQAKVRVGTIEQVAGIAPNLPFYAGFPMYLQAARSFVVLVDPSVRRFLPGVDEKGAGSLNVRALSQVCPHLGCRPNPCIEDFWFHCPCHQSRYDRLGIKPTGKGGFYGPAERGMDRFAVEVDADGVLTIDTSHVTLGPLPVTLGQPGVIPPLVPHERACS